MYRDDGPGIFRNMSSPEVEKKKKDLISIFKSNGLSSTVKTNVKVADFLDIHFELQDIYQPYKKQDDEPLYINKNSNHSPTVIKQIPKAIPKGISDISSSKEIYNQNISYYKDALKHSEYDNPYNPTQQQGQYKIEKEKRKRKIIWFNLPFSMKVKTNVGKTFLLQHHFPKRHPMQKIFNRNTVKISYCCMRNRESVISSHNKEILDEISESGMNVLWTINVLHPILCTRQRSLIKPTMNVKYISVLRKHYSKKGSGPILETSSIKSMRSALNFQNIFGL